MDKIQFFKNLLPLHVDQELYQILCVGHQNTRGTLGTSWTSKCWLLRRRGEHPPYCRPQISLTAALLSFPRYDGILSDIRLLLKLKKNR